MEYSEILKMLVLGLTAGILAGLFGIGGGLVIVPILVLIFGFEPKTAVGTSLFVILLPTGLLGVLEHWRNGNVKGYAGLCIAVRGVLRRVCRSPRGEFRLTDHDETALRGIPPGRGCLLPSSTVGDQSKPRRDRREASPPRGGRRWSVGSHGPLPPGLVEDLIDRPDVSVGIAQGEFAPAPVLIGGFAGDAQDRPFFQAVLVEFVHVGDLHLEMDAHSNSSVGKLLRMRLLGVEHQGELADAEDGEGIRCVFILGVDLDDFGADDLVVELQRPSYVLHVQEDARDTGRHSCPPLDEREEPSQIRRESFRPRSR